MARPDRHRELDDDVAVERRCERPLPLRASRSSTNAAVEPACRRGRPRVEDVLAWPRRAPLRRGSSGRRRSTRCFPAAPRRARRGCGRPRPTPRPGSPRSGRPRRRGRPCRPSRRRRRGPRSPIASGPSRAPATGVEPARGDVVAVLVPGNLLGRDAVDHLVGEDDLARAVAPEGVARGTTPGSSARGDDRDRHRRELVAVRQCAEELRPALRPRSLPSGNAAETRTLTLAPFARDVRCRRRTRVGGSCCAAALRRRRDRPLPAEDAGRAVGRGRSAWRCSADEDAASSSPSDERRPSGRRERIDGSIGRGRGDGAQEPFLDGPSPDRLSPP